MGSDYHTGKFTTLLVILFLLFIFGLAAPLMLKAPTGKKVKQTSPAVPVSSGVPDILSRVGHIVETVEGRAVLYDEPGRPVIRKNLVIDAGSRCDLGDGYSPCSLSSLPSGMRVRVSGFPSGDSAVFVSKIEIVR